MATMKTQHLPHRCCRRRGLTLLEVILALAIFFMSLLLLGRLVTMSTEQAHQVRDKARSLQICQAVLGELAAGSRSLSSGADGIIDGDDTWKWSFDKPAASDVNSDLYKVT